MINQKKNYIKQIKTLYNYYKKKKKKNDKYY